MKSERDKNKLFHLPRALKNRYLCCSLCVCARECEHLFIRIRWWREVGQQLLQPNLPPKNLFFKRFSLVWPNRMKHARQASKIIIIIIKMVKVVLLFLFACRFLYPFSSCSVRSSDTTVKCKRVQSKNIYREKRISNYVMQVGDHDIRVYSMCSRCCAHRSG